MKLNRRDLFKIGAAASVVPALPVAAKVPDVVAHAVKHPDPLWIDVMLKDTATGADVCGMARVFSDASRLRVRVVCRKALPIGLHFSLVNNGQPDRSPNAWRKVFPVRVPPQEAGGVYSVDFEGDAGFRGGDELSLDIWQSDGLKDEDGVAIIRFEMFA